MLRDINCRHAILVLACILLSHLSSPTYICVCARVYQIFLKKNNIYIYNLYTFAHKKGQGYVNSINDMFDCHLHPCELSFHIHVFPNTQHISKWYKPLCPYVCITHRLHQWSNINFVTMTIKVDILAQSLESYLLMILFLSFPPPTQSGTEAWVITTKEWLPSWHVFSSRKHFINIKNTISYYKSHSAQDLLLPLAGHCKHGK